MDEINVFQLRVKKITGNLGGYFKPSIIDVDTKNYIRQAILGDIADIVYYNIWYVISEDLNQKVWKRLK